MAARRKALSLRSGLVAAPAVTGRRAPLSNAEKARKELHQLLKTVPTGVHVLIPRNHAEAHRRPDSLCVFLGLPFRVVGPLLFAAAILVTNRKTGELSVSPEGFQLLQNSYVWQEHHRLTFEKKAASTNAIAADAILGNDPPSTRYFSYVFRGSRKPVYKYKPIATGDLVVQRDASTSICDLSGAILKGLPRSVASIIEPTDARSILVDTTRQDNNSAAPNLITPTEEQHQMQSPMPSRSRPLSFFTETLESIRDHLCNSSTEQSQSQQQLLHSPPVRSPGFSPPLRRVRRFSRSPRHQISFQAEEKDDDDDDDDNCDVIEEGEEANDYEEEEEEEEEETKEDEVVAPQPTIEEEKEASRLLDFNLLNEVGLRPSRKADGEAIMVTDRKQATASMRAKIVWLAERWGYNSATLQRDKLLIGELASRVVFYDCGFAKAPKGRMVASWVKELEDARHGNNANFGSVLENERLGSQQGTYCSRIEAAHPGYIHELYRKAGRDPKVTYRATFSEMAEAMNTLSQGDHLSRPILHLTRHHLKVWFNAHGGKVRKGWERPILTPERMKARVEWCKKRKEELETAESSGEPVYYCFLDEKWFYIRSRRKKIKVLPRGPHEPVGAADIPIERESSRRHATKVMYLAVIANPVEEHSFDGKIYLQRVARNRTLAKSTYTEHILDDLAANAALRRQWHGYVSRNENADQMIDFIAGTIFDIDEDIKQRLVIRYKDHTASGKVKWCQFKSFGAKTISTKPNEARRPLDIRDLVLQVRFKAGDEVPEDVSCDSKFMKEHMDSIGKAIREKHHWVPPDKEIYLVMDNAGGHGTHDTIDKYVAELLEDYNVRVLWQEPRGPELNLLDLGAWVSLQSAVEKHFRGNRNNAEVLARKIEDVWRDYDAAVFRKVWTRWVLALDLIIADEGNNRLVNEHRGSLFTPAAPPPPEEEALPPPSEDYDVHADADDADDGAGNLAVFATI